MGGGGGGGLQDLNYLNRDLSKVIFIDWDEKAFHSNPENAFKVKQWKGENEDVLLGELADFLRGTVNCCCKVFVNPQPPSVNGECRNALRKSACL